MKLIHICGAIFIDSKDSPYIRLEHTGKAWYRIMGPTLVLEIDDYERLETEYQSIYKSTVH